MRKLKFFIEKQTRIDGHYSQVDQDVTSTTSIQFRESDPPMPYQQLKEVRKHLACISLILIDGDFLVFLGIFKTLFSDFKAIVYTYFL